MKVVKLTFRGGYFYEQKRNSGSHNSSAANDIFGQFRYLKTDEGDIWWVAVDVARILELKNIRQNLAELDDDEKKIINLKNTVSITPTIKITKNCEKFLADVKCE